MKNDYPGIGFTEVKVEFSKEDVDYKAKADLIIDAVDFLQKKGVNAVATLFDNKRHLICYPYSIENLHWIANQHGIKRHWFHASKFPHYDIPKRKVGKIKGIEVSSKQIVSIIKKAK